MPIAPFFILALGAVASEDPCVERCADQGDCVAIEGRCQAAMDAHCEAARVCREHGHCFFVDAAPHAPGRCGDREERDAVEASKPPPPAPGTLAALLAPPSASSLAGLMAEGWRDEPGLGRTPALEPVLGASRPVRTLDPAAIQCPIDTQRLSDRQPGEYTLIWCALPDGRKKGPELLVRSGGGQRMYTEFSLDQEHGEHLITEADGRVILRGGYRLGREDGLWERWHANGVLAQRGSYEAGRKVGIWTEWSPEGVEKRCDHRDPSVPDSQCVAPAD
jgi:hypothetical protein